MEDIDSLDYDISDETALLEENAATTVTDSTSDSEDAQETATDIPGEAVLTGASTFAAQAKVSREQVRSQNREELQSIIDNPDISEEQKQQAVATMVDMTEKAEKEAAAELLLAAKGFENSVVNLTGDSADVVVPMEEIPDDKRAQIEDIVKRKTDIAPENIVITSLNQAAEEE